MGAGGGTTGITKLTPLDRLDEMEGLAPSVNVPVVEEAVVLLPLPFVPLFAAAVAAGALALLVPVPPFLFFFLFRPPPDVFSQSPRARSKPPATKNYYGV
jgi:hypothetical protein